MVEVELDMVQEKVKEEVEEKVAEEKVTGGGGGGGGWPRTFLGGRAAGVIMDMPRDPAVLASPQPPNLDHPLLVPPESPIWTLRFFMHRMHHNSFGEGRWVWADEGGIY